MKKQIFKATTLHLLFVASVLTSSSAAFAGPKFDCMVRPVYALDSLMTVEPEVRYIGYDEDYYYFELEVSNPASSKLDIVLTDRSAKYTLYATSITDQFFLKKIAVPRECVLLRWDITNKSVKGKTSEKTRTVNTEVKLKQEVKVTKW